MDNGGWIKLHRKMLENPLMNRPAYRAVWIEILLRANYDGKQEVMFDGERITLRPGQLTTGAYQLAEFSGVPRGTVERILKCFKSEEQIEMRSDRQCSLITVKKWSEYQSCEELSEERVRNDRGTSEERVRTNKEGNKEKKAKEAISKEIEAPPRKEKKSNPHSLLPGEIMSSIDDRDRSFPRKRTYGDEKVDWILDYLEWKLGRKLMGQEIWNRRYAAHLARKWGMGRVKKLLDWITDPSNWWYDKLSQVSTLYKKSEQFMGEMEGGKSNSNLIIAKKE